MKLSWNFLGEGACKTKSLPCGKYGYFLKLHNTLKIKDLKAEKFNIYWLGLVLFTMMRDKRNEEKQEEKREGTKEK